MDCYLRKAREGEGRIVYAMIAQRVKWMDENDIHQWNDTDYLDVYPPQYFEDNLERLFVLAEKETEQIQSAAIILNRDDSWNSNEPSFYIHNFVSSQESHGAGKMFITMLEKLAVKEGVFYLRLDSAEDNEKLASYYEKLGFEPCGVCSDGKYSGICRQKRVV